MGIKCSHCGWEGELGDRVPATPEWIAEHEVDAEHFTNNSLNCPQCGESSAWTLTGEDAIDVDPEGDELEPNYVRGETLGCEYCGEESEIAEWDLDSACPRCGGHADV